MGTKIHTTEFQLKRILIKALYSFNGNINPETSIQLNTNYIKTEAELERIITEAIKEAYQNL